MERKSTDAGDDLSWTRRSLLGVTAVTGTAAIAGCSGITHKTYTASDASIDQAVLDEQGFERTERETVTNTVERGWGPLSASVTAKSKLTVYADEESTPLPSESERWAASEAPLARWADNDPVRGVPASAAVETEQLTPTASDVPVESVSAAAATVLYPDPGTGGPVSLADTLVVAPGDDVDWGDRESNGTVTLADGVPVTDDEAILPAGASLPPDRR
jgi:hypothetical protein